MTSHGFVAAGLALLIGFRLRAVMGAQPSLFPDSAGYLGMAKLSFTSTDLYFGPRGFTVPLLYKLVGADPRSIVVMQAVAGICAWGLLAIAVKRQVATSWLGNGLFLLILCIALSRPVLLWDAAALSESISISMFALVTASGLLLIRSPKLPTLALLLVAALLFAFARDSNGWLLSIAASVLLAIPGVRRSHERAVAVAGSVLLISTFSIASSMLAGRSEFSLLNIYGQRILTDSGRIDYFGGNGMPVSEAVRTAAGRWASTMNTTGDPELAAFASWVREAGLGTYIRFLLTHPLVLVGEPVANRDMLLASGDYSIVVPDGFVPPPGWQLVTDITYTKDLTLFVLWAGSVTAFAVGARGWKLIAKRTVLPMLLIATTVPMMMLIWHADAMEVDRHAVQLGIQFHLGLWMMLALAADALLRGGGIADAAKTEGNAALSNPGM